jgi:hypothetical protein
VTRALDKLRAYLLRRGITTPAAALASAIAAHAVQTAPAGLAAALTTASLAGAAGGTGAAVGLLKLMAMTKLKLGLAGAVAVAGVATPLVIQHQAAVRLREENRSLQQQADQAAEQRAENEHLSRMVAQANAAHALTNNQLSELLRLRGEVGLLRGQSNELATLREENRRLQAGLAAGQNAKAAKPPPEVPPEDIFPRESWALAGFATPEATLQSYHGAMIKGDPKATAACFASPEEQARMQADMQKQFEGKSASEVAALIDSRTSSLLAFRIVARTNLPDGQAAVGYYYDGADIRRGMRFVKVGKDWKIAPGQKF